MTYSKSDAPSFSCRIDETILNEDSIKDMNDIGLSFFASLCGKNRGAFVVDPPDGQTYGCLQFPTNIAELAGLGDLSVELNDANSIKEQYVAGNITATETLSLLNFLVENVYHSSPSQDSDPYACDVNGLAKLSCPSENAMKEPLLSDGQPIRSVTLTGLLDDDSKTTYTAEDFAEMVDLAGLNTVQIVVPTSVFAGNAVAKARLSSTLTEIGANGGLKAILYLSSDTADDLQPIVAASEYAANNGVVLALTLPRGTNLDPHLLVDNIRARVGPDLPVLVPMGETDLAGASIYMNDPKVYGSLEWYHTNTVADIASSSSQEDRSKLFYHESIACIRRAPVEHVACHRNTPIFWSFGFDLAIDDCALQSSSTFLDHGQCGRFVETIDSGWWERHRKSYAGRQMFAAEQGLGWSFASWKTGDDDNGMIDSPAKLAALRDVVRAGLFPSIEELDGACLNPPANDFVMGDATFAPTLGPPPDCGNGWWNYETSQCDYWIPPPPTPEPTPTPTEPCPVCDECPVSHHPHSLFVAFFVGALVQLLLGKVVSALGKNQQRSEYSTIPNGDDGTL